MSEPNRTDNDLLKRQDERERQWVDALIIDVDSGAATVEYLGGGVLGGGARLDIVTTVGSIL